MPGPVKPDDVVKMQVVVFPELVFEAFNELIAENYVNGCATFKQGEVVLQMVNKGLDRDDIFGKGWLNVEEAYRKAGWVVVYDKPGFNESCPATFTFRKK